MLLQVLWAYQACSNQPETSSAIAVSASPTSQRTAVAAATQMNNEVCRTVIATVQSKPVGAVQLSPVRPGPPLGPGPIKMTPLDQNQNRTRVFSSMRSNNHWSLCTKKSRWPIWSTTRSRQLWGRLLSIWLKSGRWDGEPQGKLKSYRKRCSSLTINNRQ